MQSRYKKDKLREGPRSSGLAIPKYRPELRVGESLNREKPRW